MEPLRFAGLSPLTWVVVIPALTAVGILFIPQTAKAAVRRWSLLGMTVELALAAWILVSALGDLGLPAAEQVLPRLAQKQVWVRELGISWNVGADGMTAAMVFLTAVVIWAGVLVSWTVQDRTKEFYLSLIALVTGVFGVFASRDLFWFYFFYELAVIPMYLLIGIWGSTNKEYATMKLTLYLTTGAVAALVGLLMVYFRAWTFMQGTAPGWETPTFDLDRILEARDAGAFAGTWRGMDFQTWCFPFLLFGFGAIAPMWPLHTWSPMGHAAAPSAASMLHAGVLMKLGSYAILRIAIPALPEGAAWWMPVVAVLCMFNIVYGGLVAVAQKDMKFIVGYSSSSHMGYVLLGIASMTALGINGAVFLMFAHGVMTALAFALIGFFYDQTHVRTVPDLGGMSHQIPFVGTAFVFMTMASAGVPGFANFVSEAMVMFGAWQGGLRWHAVVSVFGIVITGVYLLRAVRGAFFGPRNPRWDGLRDATTPFQRLPFVFLCLVLLVFGFWPRLMTDVIAPSADDLAALLAGAGGG